MNDQNLNRLTIFNFRCPICGSEPGKIFLREYLKIWECASKTKIEFFLSCIREIINRILDNKNYFKNADFRLSCKSTLALLAGLQRYKILLEDIIIFQDKDNERFIFNSICPVCGLEAGERDKGQYFNLWEKAKNVQIANLFYESNLILWGFLKGLPDWVDGITLNYLNSIRNSFLNCCENLKLLKCPHCYRYTTCLYGDPKRSEKQVCRWCMEASDALDYNISVEPYFEPAFDFNVRVFCKTPDFTIASDKDILAPSINQKAINNNLYIGVNMDLQNEYSPNFDFMMIPHCCKKFVSGCYFDWSDYHTLLKQSLYFSCPICGKKYNSSREIFLNTAILNFELNAINTKLDKSKKNGFIILVETSREVNEFLKVVLNKEIETNNNIDINRLLNFKAMINGDREFLYPIPGSGYGIDNINFYCRSCSELLPINESFLEQKTIVCPTCQNAQVYSKKSLKNIFKNVKTLNSSILHANTEGLIYFPINPEWHPR